jgi:arylsulfatase A-like enzyme
VSIGSLPHLKASLHSWSVAAVLALMIGLAVISGAGSASADLTRPNVLIVVTNDQRSAGTMDVMTRTRSLFETGGTKFTNAFVTTPLCCPARASYLSGRYAHNTLVQQLSDATNLDQHYTLQRYLDSEYETGLFGLLMNDWDMGRDPDHWDEFAVFNRVKAPVGNCDPANPTEQGFAPNEVREKGATGPAVRRTDITQYSTDYVAAKAEEFIERHSAAGRPWMAYVTPFAPHCPFIPADRHKNDAVDPVQGPGYLEGNPLCQPTSCPQIADKPSWVQNQAKATMGNPALFEREGVLQLRMLKSVDELVERLVVAADENTLAFYGSDNGYLWGEHWLRGKSTPYTESIQVPLYMRWPANPQAVEPGGADDTMVANVDVAPTVLDALDFQQDGSVPMDGVSLIDPNRLPRNRLLTESWDTDWLATSANPQPAPEASHRTWASLKGLDPLGRPIQYVEHYSFDGVSVLFREYYNMQPGVDPGQLENLLVDGNPNDPDPWFLIGLSLNLQRARNCQGVTCVTGLAPANDLIPPKVWIDIPTDGSTVSGSQTIRAEAADNLDVIAVKFKIVNQAGQEQALADPWWDRPDDDEDNWDPYQEAWHTTTFPDGPYTVRVEARDAAGNVGLQTIQVNVDNTP